MARKVFISVLGTGFYSECVYTKDDFTSTSTRYIQQATLQMLTQEKIGGEWTKDDQIYIVLTEKAKVDNWEVPSGKRYNNKDKKEEDYIGLKSVLEQMQLPTPIEVISIPDGNNEHEIWTIFDRIYKKLNKEDRLYLDLTHAFRYIPMLLLVLVNYSKFLNLTKVEQITYGNWENRDRSQKPEVAQIIDITPLAVLQDWTNAAADYIEHGDAEQLYSLAQDKLYFSLRNPNDNRNAAQVLNNLCRNINAYCDSLSFNRGMSIINGKEGIQIMSYLEQADSKIIVPLQPLFEKIRISVEQCAKDNPANMIYAAGICAKHKNYQQAITLLREGIISIICSRHNIKQDDSKKRELVVTAILKHLSSENSNTSDENSTKLTQEEIDKIISDVYPDSLLTADSAGILFDILDYRNDFNHAGMRSNRKRVSTMKENIQDLISRSRVFLEEEYAQENPNLPHLLINLSNHPYEKWTEKQKEAAKEYGEVRDMPFPIVDPEDDADQIREIADKYIAEIIKLNAEHAVTVHLMGEMSFVVYAVSRLSERGIRCICSTSERDTEDLGNGEKKVTFRFKRFRDYDC